ncbi:hypothetical protein HYG81_20470 (plasmid) [Natrinema zhouii]|uniref:hypothetical protein n=1 Tax=Natrinema zhouii TaxID=1710539 RepID=UPI001CFF9183|nr:hypothetical protein [Natrinema zhouii]UHQ98002.1 hypothetical protein HYG81_20470 [Natrinema zhouii]
MAHAHVLLFVKGWNGETAFKNHLDNNRELAEPMEFDSPPRQKALWKAWGERFSERHRKALQRSAEEVVGLARYYGVPTPDDVFQLSDDGPNKTESQLTVEKTREV